MGSEASPIVPEGYHIAPGNIDTSKPLMGAFNKLGREVFASTLIINCQLQGYWTSMNRATIENVCKQLGANICFLDWFIEQHLIVCDRYGNFCLTEAFVKRCYEVSPKK
ncbi:MAG: hypothetical protein HZA35_03865 [Parcubacteria group bacterium]|nr:hypothetical protein [Parcubacteria group bacterium]